MKVLFIGNSHTYFNDMPQIFREICECGGISMEVVMLAHGGKGFDFHAQQPEVRFNLQHGGYNYAILQHVAHPFGDEEAMFASARELAVMVPPDTQPILYMTWPEKQNPEGLARMAKAYMDLGKELHFPIAPAGLAWREFHTAHPETELYFTDGEHASAIGSMLAAYTIAAAVFRTEGKSRALRPRIPEEAALAETAVHTLTAMIREGESFRSKPSKYQPQHG